MRAQAGHAHVQFVSDLFAGEEAASHGGHGNHWGGVTAARPWGATGPRGRHPPGKAVLHLLSLQGANTVAVSSAQAAPPPPARVEQIPRDPVAPTVFDGWQFAAMDTTHDRRPGDAKKLRDLADREPLMGLVGSVIDALVPAGGPGGLGSSLGSATFGQMPQPAHGSGRLRACPLEVRSPLRMSLATLLKWQPRIAAASS